LCGGWLQRGERGLKKKKKEKEKKGKTTIVLIDSYWLELMRHCKLEINGSSQSGKTRESVWKVLWMCLVYERVASFYI
jgi:hypothetical protein